MRKLEFDDFQEFACEIADMYEDIRSNDRYDDVSVIAKYDEAVEVVKELLCLGYGLYCCELHAPEWDGYNDEYMISLMDGNLYVDPAKQDDGYLDEKSCVTYVMDNCSSKALKHITSPIQYEISISGSQHCDGDCDGDCENCFAWETPEDPVEKPTAKEAAKTEYKVNGKTVDRAKYDEAYEKLMELLTSIYEEKIGGLDYDYNKLLKRLL